MNALVSDQVSRLRRMIGDPDERFIKIFRKTCGDEVRRPQFGMYTGRTPTLEFYLPLNRTENLKKPWQECPSHKAILKKNSSIICSKKEKYLQKRI